MAEIFTKVLNSADLNEMKQINLTILKTELRDLIEAISEQLDALINLDGKIPQIEYDIIMENIRRMYESLQVFYRLNDTAEKKIFHSRKTVNEKVDPSKEAENPLESTLFTVEDLSFSKKLQEARERSMGTGSKDKTPGDLKSLININEKFLFINELFDGNLRDYSQAIDRLNIQEDKREAFAILEEMFKKNLWDAQSMAFKKLTEIIEKRFA